MSSMSPAQFTPSKLLARQTVAERTMSFRFQRPHAWTFKAGQTLDLTLLNPPETDDEGNTRTFSIASAPHEETLMIATRMRDTAFKRVLKTMPVGMAVKIDGPAGDLTLHNKAQRPAVLLAGGIGITPFHSMVSRAAHDKLAHSIYLFYSNRHPEDAAFLEELRALEGQNPNYHLIATMTEASPGWQGETGRIDSALLARHLQGVESPIYYIAGPPQMVQGLHAMLNQAQVDDDDIRFEEFAGY